MTRLALRINGAAVEAEVEPRTSLADFLRLEQRLTGTHLGCEHGVCGACTVLIDGQPARSCITFAVALEGREVRTVEGFDGDPVMAKLRQAFHEEHALQCGFCTSGMLITARDIVTRLAAADERRIRSELAGNLCRCTGYMGIVNALLRTLGEMPTEARLGKAPAEAAPAARPAAPFAGFTAKPSAASPAQAAEAPAASFGLPPEPGWSRIADHFELATGPREAWRLFGDVPRIARAMPGAELEESEGGKLKGRMRVAFGPIKASFAGTATLVREEAAMSGRLEGGGSDERGGSRAKGRVSYRILPRAGGGSRVELLFDYQLQGPLAQFARPGLVKDFAQQLMAAFARNLEQGAAAAEAAAPLKAGTLFWSVLWTRIKRLFGRGG